MKILNWKDVEVETGVSKHRIKYAVERGRLGGFTTINGAYVFSDEDVERIKEYFVGRECWQRHLSRPGQMGDKQ